MDDGQHIAEKNYEIDKIGQNIRKYMKSTKYQNV